MRYFVLSLLLVLGFSSLTFADQAHNHMMGHSDQQMVKQMKRMHWGVTKEAQSYNLSGFPMFGQAEEFVLSAYQFGFYPEKIKVKKGQRVRLYATAKDVRHGIYIKQFGINVPVELGQVQIIEFIADKEGEFDIKCSVYCGKGHHKMKAVLVVEE